MKKIQLYIISGFLGSGKTTLLVQLIKQWQDQKVAILMNEYGGFNVDSKILGDAVPSHELLNGCICCDLKSDVEVQLHDMKHRYQPDIIIIEATGVAHPVEIYDACSAPSLTEILDIQAVVTLVDGPRFLDRGKLSVMTKRLMEEQVQYAHIVLLNKCDLLDEQEVGRLQSDITAINQRAELIMTTYSQVDAVQLAASGAAFEAGPHSHHGIQSLVYTFTGPVNSRRFVDWLRSMPSSILRVKGFIKFQENPEQVVLFQYAYGIPQYEPEAMNLPLKLVIIGEALDKSRLLDQLDQLQFG
ncbi:CobW family GTP-binding protein [Macrococcus equipercicus]|uniref:GTP-binding protein n=1 Tax=Macrococcus equipercicus TaxID=69967 RepID=A0A9Q9F2E0_9STAP|nr:GTP-binding protein [Macrococcus equipercicus]KAA1042782.1 GTP-binding protein [Macrococcus equipercicus]UTH14291.1 GTP-binding protein [Macrococcus equipercicus]